MELFLFIAYLLLFTWCITRIRFFSSSGLSRFQLVILFLLKVAAGIGYGWVHRQAAADTWVLHAESLKETKILLTSPLRYLSSFFYNPYANSFGSFFASSASYWNNLKNNTYIRIESVFNCFSFGSYFINIIFYSFLTFFGVVAIYRVMRRHLQANGRLLILACFLVPSFLFWTSGLHKDGLCFLTLGTIIYISYFRRWRQKPWQSGILLLAAFLLLFALRNHLLLVLLPALLAWALAERFPAQRIRIVIGIYGLALLLFFTAKYISPALNFPAIVLSKQEAFMRLQGGGSEIAVEKLQPDFTGFAQQFPRALSTAILRPFITDLKKPIILPAFVEILILGICSLIFFIFPKRKKTWRPFSLFLLAFSASVLLMIGYTVNNLGAVVRYRAILFPLFVPPLLFHIDWQALFQKLHTNKK